MHTSEKMTASALQRWRESTVTENTIQRAICKLLTVMENQGLLRFYAVPNGGSRNVVEATNMKKTGTKRGVPDLVILLPGGKSVYWEIKTPKGSIRLEQREWAEWLKSNGYDHAFIRSFDEAEKELKRYF